MPKKMKLWSVSVGQRGNRVRLYEPRPGAPLMRSLWINGKEDRKSLGHCDRDRAVREAHQLLSRCAAERAAAAPQPELTVRNLVAEYTRSPAHEDKKPRTRKEDEAKLNRWVQFLGARRKVASITESDVRRFARDRMTRRDRPVKARTVEADFVALRTALNWAMRERDSSGKRLLSEDPLIGVSVPREKNPRRPVMTHRTFGALAEVAAEVDPMLRPALIVAEGTGRRISAWRTLRWEDIDFGAQTIRWRAENDKKGYEQVVPFSAEVSHALSEWRRLRPAIGTAWVFPSPKNPSAACDRHLLDRWLRRAFRKAGIKPEPGGMWHSLRRKWATERKDFPIRDLAFAGGWRDPQTPLRCYQQADEATVREVVLNPRRRYG